MYYDKQKGGAASAKIWREIFCTLLKRVSRFKILHFYIIQLFVYGIFLSFTSYKTISRKIPTAAKLLSQFIYGSIFLLKLLMIQTFCPKLSFITYIVIVAKSQLVFAMFYTVIS